ncbi:uncharacterized protein N7483_008829 [Penicillium malachiteum]|uniref:uncharacterized protein n=1 Tax=Penicillium malachiteum TaxID=1324776 RepID=UPI0025496CED|nr:uncharacterized protein N7483_008829 [Penicillium malachiteum]KAJ5720895.1 hypothetical protein N7483_008829 [Penicillium malachiteum]
MVRQPATRSSRSRAAGGRGRGRGRQSGRGKSREIDDENEVSDVYQEMLNEAEARDPEQFRSDHQPLKRRRAGTKAAPVSIPSKLPTEITSKQSDIAQSPRRELQTVYDSTTEDESDIEWEDVSAPGPSLAPDAVQDRDETLQILLDNETEAPKKPSTKRKPLTAADRARRFQFHKFHLVGLLFHVAWRNAWCNDSSTQQFLKSKISERAAAMLRTGGTKDKPPHGYSKKFKTGVTEVAYDLEDEFLVLKKGLSRAHWEENRSHLKARMVLESMMYDYESSWKKEDFQNAARKLEGSQDFGTQLFCCILRGLGVETRLVCSLQPLPFSGTSKNTMPSKAAQTPTRVSDDDTSPNDQQQSANPSQPARIQRIGRPQFKNAPAKSVPADPSPSQEIVIRPIPPYPVYWVEVFNEGTKDWEPVKPFGKPVNRYVEWAKFPEPNSLEPPANNLHNSMNYVVAFEADGSARDVTRRYTKFFNAKTRKLRVESVPKGEEWWKRVMGRFEKKETFRTRYFKDHPFFALKRHLRRNEVIYPEHVTGRVSTGKGKTSEAVYRRANVHIVRSAAKWYRLGRELKEGEQPMKHVTTARPKNDFASDEDEDDRGSALYAESQTKIYVPPPVVDGRVPKNIFRNIDIYVPSMVPQGGVHIKSPDASKAARILGVDFSDAVTGFNFKGRRGTAVITGIVIAAEYEEALNEVMESMNDEREQAAVEAKTAETLRLWRLFLLKLRIARRVQAYASDDEQRDEEVSFAEDMSDGSAEGGGGFFPDTDEPMWS